MDEKTIGLHLRVNDPTFSPLSFQKLLEFTPLLLKAWTNRCFVQLSEEHKMFLCFHSGSLFCAHQKMVLPQAAGVRARTEADPHHMLEALCTPDTPPSAPVRRVRDQRAYKDRHQKIWLTRTLHIADIPPDSLFCLWSCPPLTPSPSGGARSQSGWRSGRGSGSGSSGSSSSWWTPLPPEDVQKASKHEWGCFHF